MTTIAYRDGILAADSGITYDDAIPTKRSKVIKLSDGSLFAGTGYVSSSLLVQGWLSGELPKPNTSDLDESFFGILINASGDVVTFDRTLVHIHDNAPFYAIGSGWKFAWGAMAAGASAIEAVVIACDVDSGSGLPVTFERLSNANLEAQR